MKTCEITFLSDCLSFCLSLCVSPPIFVMRLARSPCSLGMNIPPNFFCFYTVRVVSKESRRLILPRTSCCIWFFWAVHDGLLDPKLTFRAVCQWHTSDFFESLWKKTRHIVILCKMALQLTLLIKQLIC
jgi:hypothetical protein